MLFPCVQRSTSTTGNWQFRHLFTPPLLMLSQPSCMGLCIIAHLSNANLRRRVAPLLTYTIRQRIRNFTVRGGRRRHAMSQQSALYARMSECTTPPSFTHRARPIPGPSPRILRFPLAAGISSRQTRSFVHPTTVTLRRRRCAVTQHVASVLFFSVGFSLVIQPANLAPRHTPTRLVHKHFTVPVPQ